jgi:hypothetical protein
MHQVSRNAMRYALIATVGFLLATAVRTADAAPMAFESNYAVAYDGYSVKCSGNPGNECDEPGS